MFKDPDFEYRWVNADKLGPTMGNGWVLVVPQQERNVGVTNHGTPLYAYLCQMPKAKYAERQAKKGAAALEIAVANAPPEERDAVRKMWTSGEGFSPPEWVSVTKTRFKASNATSEESK